MQMLMYCNYLIKLDLLFISVGMHASLFVRFQDIDKDINTHTITFGSGNTATPSVAYIFTLICLHFYNLMYNSLSK